MQLFMDTANVEEIRRMYEMGFVSGVTTNPSLVAREKQDYTDILRQITAIVEGPISAEVLKEDAPGMVEEARKLAAIHPNIVIKIPLTAEGLKAIHQLKTENIATNATLIFSAAQALLAARAGARFVSPFLGRVDDMSNESLSVLADIVDVFALHDLNCQIIAASIRSPWQVVEAARIGADIATVPTKILEQMIHHPLTDIGLERFRKDWEEAQKSL